MHPAQGLANHFATGRPSLRIAHSHCIHSIKGISDIYGQTIMLMQQARSQRLCKCLELQSLKTDQCPNISQKTFAVTQHPSNTVPTLTAPSRMITSHTPAPLATITFSTGRPFHSQPFPSFQFSLKPEPLFPLLPQVPLGSSSAQLALCLFGL